MLHRLSLLLLLLCSAYVAPAKLTVYNMEALDIWKDVGAKGHGFVKVYCDNRHIGTTKVKRNTANPLWEEHFWYGRAHEGNKLKLRVYDKDDGFDQLLGICETTIMMGSYQHTCDLFRGGLLKYRYFLQ